MRPFMYIAFRTTALLFATVVVIVIIGCDRHLSNPILNGSGDPDPPMSIGERESGTLYKLGEVLVQYDEETWEQADTTDTLFPVIDKFFRDRGYVPSVKEVLPGFRTQVVKVDEAIDLLPMFEELKAIPEVKTAELNTLLGIFDIATRESLAYQPSIIPSEFVQIRPVKGSRTEDGLLYRLGSVVVQYDYRTFTEMMDTSPTPIAVVNEFLISKGYTPRIVNVFFHFNVEVIDIGEDIDPAFMFEELKALPGVIDVQRNILYDILERLSGDIPIPVTPSILAE